MFQRQVRDRIGWLARRTGRHTDRRGLIRLRPGLEGLEVRAVPALGGLNLQTGAGGLTPNGIGFGPNAVAVGDFNGDGKPDVVVANGRSGISVMLNNGNGTFQPAQNFGSGGFDMSEVAVGDFDGDGRLDIAATGHDSVMFVFHNNGDGTFVRSDGGFVGTNLTAIAVGDLNGDGKPDIVMTDAGIQTHGTVGNTVDILFNDGTGHFNINNGPRVLQVGNQPNAIALADMNHDGHLDILTANTRDGTVSELLGNGNGTFQGLRNFGVGGAVTCLAVGDLNGDGNPDIVAGLSAGRVTVLTGKGDGSFSTAGSFNAGVSVVSIAIGDFNGDGQPDVVTTGGTNAIPGSTSAISVLAGTGTGTLAPPLLMTTGAGPVSLAAADLNGDGLLDVVTAGSGGVSVLLNDGIWPIPLPVEGGGGGPGGGGGGGGGGGRGGGGGGRGGGGGVA